MAHGQLEWRGIDDSYSGSAQPIRIRRATCLGLVCVAVVAAGTAGLGSARADTYSGITIQSTAGGQAAGRASDEEDGQNHAVVFLANGALSDLNPAGYIDSRVTATNGTLQVGLAIQNQSITSHAMLWSGSAGSAVDLHPAAGFDLASIGTGALGISPDGTQQVGYGAGSATGLRAHALLWSGTANSVIDLNPTGFQNTYAYGADGARQVGYGEGSATRSFDHALLWSGTAASSVDLQPTHLTGFVNSFAYGIGGAQQVGYGSYNTDGYYHALLWTGTAASAVDLSPPADQFNNSIAYCTNGTKQVGYEDFGVAYKHAMVWSGTANSEVDLNALLPADGEWTSVAYSINASGNIFGWANGTLNGVFGDYAVEWSPTVNPALSGQLGQDAGTPDYTATVLYQLATPVPEPASLGMLGLAAALLLRRRPR